MIRNDAKGKRFFGLHFYPGVAEYTEVGKDPYRVFLNEDTLRAMDASFEGRPVFVMHVDGVEDDIDELRKEADGWVIRSFYNAADGKHWAEFIVVSERGEKAIARGMRLSNCYEPKSFGQGGLWNGVKYAKEITGGEYEHLAIVPNPRYEESVILTPEEFKAYNEDKHLELKRLANEKEGKPMALKFFKKAKVENAVDLESMSVVLPKSGKEISISELVTNADDKAEKDKKGEPEMANDDHMVEVGGAKMSVGELKTKHQAMCDALEAHKKSDDPDEDGDPKEENADDDFAPAVEPTSIAGTNDDGDDDEEPKKKKSEVMDVRGDKAGKDKTENQEDEDDKLDKEKKKNELAAKKQKDKEKADRVRNAPDRAGNEETALVSLSVDRVEVGKKRYGS